MKPARKRLFLLGITLVCCILILETTPYWLYPLRLNRSFNRSQIQQSLHTGQAPGVNIEGMEQEQAHEDQSWIQTDIIHPYLGYMTDRKNSTVDGFYFFEYYFRIPKREDHYRIIVFGGSVAGNVSADNNYLKEQIHQHLPHLKDKKLFIWYMAYQGYKQPQQLLALNYLLFLDAQIDMVINLDGFNDIALAYAENKPAGVNPYYPRSWQLYAMKGLNVEVAVQMGQLYNIREQQTEWRETMNHFPLNKSNFGLAIWDLKHQGMEAQFQEKYTTLALRMDSTDGFSNAQALGPKPVDPEVTNEGYFEDLAHKWAAASHQMDQLCKANGIAYYHFLQPNLHDPGSKPLTPEETALAQEDNAEPFHEAVLAGYPLLKTKGQQLQQQAVNFYDLSQVFHQTTPTLYVDYCCHVNNRGNRLMIDAMVQYFQQHPPTK